MNNIKVGLNMEYVRHADLSFTEGIRKAAEMGYEYVEPWLMNGRELMCEAGYFMTWSMEEDPREMREILDQYGVKCLGVSAHSPLMKPEVGVDYLRNAIRFASDLGAQIVCTDEGHKPDWLTDDQAFFLMEYALRKVMPVAERYGIYIGIEPHGVYTTQPPMMERILSLVDSPYLRVNFDTGNAYLAGQDPVEYLSALADRVVHVHAKDIALSESEAKLGKVTGVPAGCACGDGLVDWPAIIDVLRDADYNGVLSVECGTIEQAEKSLHYLSDLLKS